MLDQILRFFGQGKGNSSSDAKQRLKFLLLHDEVDLSPAQVEKMKAEILEVIQRYVDIDAESVDFRLDKADGQVALVSNMPVRRVTARRAVAGS